MGIVTYSMSVSLDGYIVGPDSDFDWTAPDDKVFRFWIDEIPEVGVHLLGRRLYETMLYWETAEQDQALDEAEREWAAIWNPLPKVVFSTTLSAVQGNARLVSGGLAREIERLRAEPGEGAIAIGGARLAAEAAEAGLIDQYRAMVYPVLVGGGVPFFPQDERRVDLELIRPARSTPESCTSATSWRVDRLSCPLSRGPHVNRPPTSGPTHGDAPASTAGASGKAPWDRQKGRVSQVYGATTCVFPLPMRAAPAVPLWTRLW
jgi:dihydrofolate reductase